MTPDATSTLLDEGLLVVPDDVDVHAAADAYVVHVPTTGAVHRLEGTALHAWAAFAEPASLDDVVAGLARAYDVPAAVVRTDCQPAVATLLAEGLLTPAHAARRAPVEVDPRLLPVRPTACTMSLDSYSWGPVLPVAVGPVVVGVRCPDDDVAAQVEQALSRRGGRLSADLAGQVPANVSVRSFSGEGGGRPVWFTFEECQAADRLASGDDAVDAALDLALAVALRRADGDPLLRATVLTGDFGVALAPRSLRPGLLPHARRLAAHGVTVAAETWVVGPSGLTEVTAPRNWPATPTVTTSGAALRPSLILAAEPTARRSPFPWLTDVRNLGSHDLTSTWDLLAAVLDGTRPALLRDSSPSSVLDALVALSDGPG